MIMRILFIGGTGNISLSCSRQALKQGAELYLLTRGQSKRATVPNGARLIQADIRQPAEAAKALGDLRFDAVANFIAYDVPDIEADLKLFRGRTRQYVFISTASVYQKPPIHPVITESTPLCNPYWAYSQRKIACEERLQRAYREDGFPITIVRPAHTYDMMIPGGSGQGNYGLIQRIRAGTPVIVHGDGSSLWTLTHAEDFAKGFTGLLGLMQAIGHAFHITSDELLTWNQIYRIIGEAAGVEPKLLHIPTDFIAKMDANLGAGLLGDKAWSHIWDNTKIKQFVPGYCATIPFAQGFRRSLAWFEADPARQLVDEKTWQAHDRIIAAWQKAMG
jgi:nucleoside-diphosphate-sugar epimerase